MAYRSELVALEERRQQLVSDLRDVDDNLRAARKRQLPLLDRVRIPAPCPVPWDHMVGDDKVRFCGKCAKNVYNLSAMTRAEAEQLLGESGGNLCAQLRMRQDGTVLTTDCAVVVRRKRLRRVVTAGVGAAILSAAGIAAASAMPKESSPPCVARNSLDSAPTSNDLTLPSWRYEPPTRMDDSIGGRMKVTSMAGGIALDCVEGDPLCGSARSVGPFDRGAAAAALGSINVASCKKPDGPTGIGHVTVTFSPSGAVTSAVPDSPPFAGTPAGACIAGKFRAAHVPAFAGGNVTVGKSFRLD